RISGSGASRPAGSVRHHAVGVPNGARTRARERSAARCPCDSDRLGPRPGPRVADADAQLAFALADYRRPATWRLLARAVGLLHALDVPLAEAVAFAGATLGDIERRNARRMLRARYADADWLDALKGIMDPIREQKRDALVAHLLATNPNLTGKADLYDYFLTDTEWSAKMPSSRIVHAHETLQLY